MNAMPHEQATVVITGAGPAGLSAAREATKLGLKGIIVLERESQAGGAPRHCGHLGFGLRDFGRAWTGPRYAEHLRNLVKEIDLRCSHSVTGIGPQGLVEVSGPQGPYSIQAQRILIATGTYEKSCAARLVSGARPFGILTTGALQRFAYLHGCIPCRAPVVVGTEVVAYSTILTLRHFGAKPVAFIEADHQSHLSTFASLGARLIYGVPTIPGVRIVSIEGEEKVTAVKIEGRDGPRTLHCDGIVFSGEWIPETTLVRSSHITMDATTRGPAIDTHYRTDDSVVYAAGNVLRSARSAGTCALEGRAAARAIFADLQNRSPGSNLSHGHHA
jgi:thioredoxin reductase